MNVFKASTVLRLGELLLISCLLLALIKDENHQVQAHGAAAVSASVSSAGSGTSVASTSSTRLRNGNVVEGITDAMARSSKKLVNAGTDNMLTGTDGFAKLYKDTVGRPVTTAGVAVQNMATSLSNANKVFSDGIRAGIDDTMSRPMASIGSTYQNLLASGGASSGAFFDNAITKPFSLFGAATRDLLSSSFPSGEATTTTSVGEGAAAAAVSSARRKRQISGSASMSAGSSSGGSGSSLSGSASAELSSSGSSSSGGSSSGGSSLGQSQASGSTGSGSSGSLSASASGSSGGSGGSSLSAGASLSSSGSSSSDQSSSSSAQASASLSIGSTTPKPEGGLLSKVKEIFKESKEAVKSSVESLTKDDDKKSSISAEASGSFGSAGSAGSASASLSASGGSPLSNGSSPSGTGSGSSSSGGSASAGASLSASLSAGGGSSSSGGGDRAQASAQVSIGSNKREGEGLIDKLSDMAKKGKEHLKETANEIKDKAKEVKEEIKQVVGLGDSQQNGGESNQLSAGGSIKLGGLQASANVNMKDGGRSAPSSSSSASAQMNFNSDQDPQQQQQQESPGPVEKLQKLVNKGSEVVRETVNKIEDKVSDVTDKVYKTLDDNITKPMAQVSGSGRQMSEGHMSAQAQANVQLKGESRERYLMDVKRRQELELGQRPNSLKEIISSAKARGVIPKNEDRSVLAGNHADEKSVTVEVLDKMHEISKLPVEKVLKPLDKVLGYEKDPLIRIYDNSHEILRRPISLVSKPVESVLTGAFKTSDEAKRDYDKLLQTTSEQERREAKMREERARKEDRSVVGEIADRTVELAEKPFEIILKPVDHLLGFDKEGKKNPLLRIIDDLYGLSKKPVDALAKPFESILRKMAEGGQSYQVSVRFRQSPGSSQDTDPKLITRLADGALNIADRVLTKPLEIVMKPLNHALGYDEPGKRNPIVDAAHSLKNATKLGVELFTRPIDRILKEIADIGAIKDEAEREAMLERKREEASRLVRALDRLHELAQVPFEIVLRPVDRALGLSREGRKEPLLRAWDVIHQVFRAPIQVVSKPVEDALLGEQQRKPKQQGGAKAQISGQIGPIKGSASVNVGAGSSGASASASASAGSRRHDHGESRRNFIIDGIKKVERMAVKPIEVITSPIRRLILGEDDEKVGTDTEKNNRAVQAKAMGQSPNGRPANQGPDKIIKTLENMNNVVLRPLEVITQPIAEILSSDDNNNNNNKQDGQKKLDVKVQSKVQSTGGGDSSSGQKSQVSASAQAQIKKN